MSDSSDNDKAPIIIIKKIKKGGGGHHGGAWKVAYADFVTAMMAFFLLLWLLSVTTADQKQGIADFFAPQVVSASRSGSGGVMGGTTISPDGAMTNTTSQNVDTGDAAKDDSRKKTSDAALDKEDEESFKDVEESIKEKLESDPELKALSENLLIDMTPEGLRIQIVDQKDKPMFKLGSAEPLAHTKKLIKVITDLITELPNKLSLRGHTDSIPYGKGADYTNWELSSDRANATRREMIGNSLKAYRFANVQGKADREHLDTDNPNSARNRRVSIILLKQSLVRAEKNSRTKTQKVKVKKPEPKKPEEGVIYFP